MNVYMFGYRHWAYRLARDTDEKITRVFVPEKEFEDAKYYFTDHDYYNEKDIEVLPVTAVDPKNLDKIRATFTKDDILLFYGWSWIVPPSFTDELNCICLHPSPLPKYRGGSPIQNQVIAGETVGAVTLFKMGQGLDDGPIIGQQCISLAGYLHEIEHRIYSAGWDLTKNLLLAYETNTVTFTPQDEAQATFCKRRKPSDSQILPTETALEVYNKVRCLQNPYPRAFILGSDNKKIYLQKVDYDK